MYDIEMLHDPDIDCHGLLPYQSPYYKSIYEGVTVEIHIVDHCNLNCAGCNHFSPLAEPWFISVEEFKNSITLLKQNIPTVKELLLLGGEPTLHPQLLDLCKIAREILPKERIRILSNGVNTSILKKSLNEFAKIDICIDFCSYPWNTDYETITKMIDEYNQTSYMSYFNTRHISRQTLVDTSGQQNKKKNFYYCSYHSLPCLTLKNNKIFICPFTAHREHYEKKAGIILPLIEGEDYLNLADIKGNLDILQDFCFTPKNSCHYCNQTADEWIWHLSHEDITEYTIPLSELYFTDYDRYYNIINKHFDYFIECCSERNPKNIDLLYGARKVEQNLTRLGLGKIDIIIPHYNINEKIASVLINTLMNQTIINECTVYFISDDSPNERDLIKYLPIELNYVLLKNKENLGPGATRNLGFEHSYNKYVLFLDADDYFCSETALEDLYNKAESENYDIVKFMMYANNESDSNKWNFLLNRNFLNNHNIKFNNLFFGEDLVFYANLMSKNAHIYNYNNKNNLFAVYNKYNDNCLSNTLQDNNYINYFVSRLLALQYQPEEECYRNILFTLQHFVQDHRSYLEEDINKVLLYWLYYQIYQINPNLFIKYNSNNAYLFDFINNYFQVTISNTIIYSEQDARTFLLNEISPSHYTRYALNIISSY